MTYQPKPSDPDEPVFTLKGGDADAPALVRAWAYRRQGQFRLAEIEAAKADVMTQRMDPQSSGDPQILSAFRIADQMEQYARDRAVRASAKTDNLS